MLALYRMTGHLTDAIPDAGIAAAQEYLTNDDMTKYFDTSWADALGHIEWRLDGNGYDYRVDAYVLRELTDEELKELGSWVSGQNSDGLGESFEQQDFAWLEDPDFECDCDGGGEWCNCSYDAGRMCSFDWETNEHRFVRIK